MSTSTGIELSKKCECVCVPAYRLGAVNVSRQADDQVVSDGVNQVTEAGVAVQHVIQRRGLHAEVLLAHTHTLNKTIMSPTYAIPHAMLM